MHANTLVLTLLPLAATVCAIPAKRDLAQDITSDAASVWTEATSDAVSWVSAATSDGASVYTAATSDAASWVSVATSDAASVYTAATSDAASLYSAVTSGAESIYSAATSALNSDQATAAATLLFQDATSALGTGTSAAYATVATVDGTPVVQVTSVGGPAITLATGAGMTTSFAGHVFTAAVPPSSSSGSASPSASASGSSSSGSASPSGTANAARGVSALGLSRPLLVGAASDLGCVFAGALAIL